MPPAAPKAAPIWALPFLFCMRFYGRQRGDSNSCKGARRLHPGGQKSPCGAFLGRGAPNIPYARTKPARLCTVQRRAGRIAAKGLCPVLQMPDFGVVLRDGAVGAEIARPGDVGEHLFGPGGAVLVAGQGAGFGGDVVLDVEQRHEPVLVLHVLPQRMQRRRVPDGEQRGREQEIHQILDAGAGAGSATSNRCSRPAVRCCAPGMAIS